MISWKEKQQTWKRAIDNSDLSYTDFAKKYDFCRVSLSNWLHGHTRASPDNELRMDSIIKNNFYKLSFED